MAAAVPAGLPNNSIVIGVDILVFTTIEINVWHSTSGTCPARDNCNIYKHVHMPVQRMFLTDQKKLRLGQPRR